MARQSIESGSAEETDYLRRGWLAPRKAGEWRRGLLDLDAHPEVRELVSRFAPVLKLHPKETSLPCSIDWFLERCDLWYGGYTPKRALGLLGGQLRRVVVKRGPLRQSDLTPLRPEELREAYAQEFEAGGQLHGLTKAHLMLCVAPESTGGQPPQRVRVHDRERLRDLQQALEAAEARLEALGERARSGRREELQESGKSVAEARKSLRRLRNRTVRIHRAPIYAFVRERAVPRDGRGLGSADVDSADPVEVYEITYVMAFAGNPGPPCCFSCWRVGQHTSVMHAHPADFEHITVRVVKEDLTPFGVFFGGHGYRDGHWHPLGDYQRRGQRPIAGLGLGSHATYAHEGCHCRIAGIGNDFVSFGGVEWDPAEVVVANDDYERTQWMDFRGDWSHRGVGSPWEQKWLYMGETHTSNTCVRRVCTGCIPLLQEACLAGPRAVLAAVYPRAHELYQRVRQETGSALEWVLPSRPPRRRAARPADGGRGKMVPPEVRAPGDVDDPYTTSESEDEVDPVPADSVQADAVIQVHE